MFPPENDVVDSKPEISGLYKENSCKSITKMIFKTCHSSEIILEHDYIFKYILLLVKISGIWY